MSGDNLSVSIPSWVITAIMATTLPTTIITKRYSTSTFYDITAGRPFHPELASGTLFEFGSLNKGYEGFLFVTHLLILSTGQMLMILSPTVETVPFHAQWAIEPINPVLILKHN